MVELIVNGERLELPMNGNEIKYTKQIADIFDLAKVSSSYTNSFIAPKNAQNTQVFDGLGLPGDQSIVPYSKIEASYKNNGFDVISKGWLNISETSDNYKLSIIDGMIDFFKDIENKTMGVDLDLSNFQHQKDLPTVLASKDNEYYTYIIADYGGRNRERQGVIPGPYVYNISIDYQVPSFSMRKLFDLIFTTFGYTWESEYMEYFLTNLWITYPTPPTYVEASGDLIATLNKGFYSTNDFLNIGGKAIPRNNQNWDSSTIIEGQLISNHDFIIPETTGYKIDVTTEAYYNLKFKIGGSDNFLGAWVNIQRNGTTILLFQTDPYAAVSKDVNMFLNEGDIITYQLYAFQPPPQLYIERLNHNSTVMTVKKIDQGDVSPTNALKSFKITDFLKEILWRTGLVPTINEKHVTFTHVRDWVDFDNAIDWSDKYVKRKSETYIRSSYSQRNLFKMKYNEGEEENDDGVIEVNNKNIDEERTIGQSVIYSPNEKLGLLFTKSKDPLYVPIIPIYQSEVKENGEGFFTEYKNLDNRFYLIRKKNIVADINLRSIEIPANQDVSNWNFASLENTLLGTLVNENFAEYSLIFNNFKAHNIELNLTLIDLLQLDFTRPYYFSKEGMYYILNKVTFQEGETTMGEFIRINK